MLRRLAVGPEVALVIAVLYALTPYHFMRGEVHLFLAAYYVVPIGAYLALSVLDGRARIGLATGALAALVALASGSFYYSAFTVLLVAVAAVLRFFAARDRRAFLPAGFVVGVILAVSLVQLAPTIVYRVANGTNEEVAKRYWFESENYSLRLTQLLLPVDGHRVDALASRKAEYTEQIPQNEGRAATLGIVASVGFLWLLAVVLLAVVGAWPGVIARYRGIAALTLASVLVATTGGLATLLAVVFAADPGVEPALDLHRVLRARWRWGSCSSRCGGASRPRVRGCFSSGCSWSARRPDVVLVHPAVRRARRRLAGRPSWYRSVEAAAAGRRVGRAASLRAVPRAAARAAADLRAGEVVPPHVGSPMELGRDARAARGLGRCERDAARRGACRRPRERRASQRSSWIRLGYGDDGAAAETDLRGVLGVDPERSPDGRYLLWRL